jgi:hypothetical protein
MRIVDELRGARTMLPPFCTWAYVAVEANPNGKTYNDAANKEFGK